MWEFWRSRISKGKTRHRPRGSEDDSPGTARSTDLEGTGVDTYEQSSKVFFRDAILPASESEEEDSEASELGIADGSETRQGLSRAPARIKRKQRVDRQKLIIILVGLPGRGKTFLCNKLMCYLNWLGHETRHFNVGSYRRKQRGEDEIQNADLFDHKSKAGMRMRERALFAALDDLEDYLRSENGQVAIFDATNTTEERRQLLKERFHGTWQYLFIESICNDPAVLEQNYRHKMMYSPDYSNVDTEAALTDFRDRIAKYEEVYETITDRNSHYIKLIDMVTGRGYMDVNRISGYIPGKMVFYLMQVCKAGLNHTRKIWLTRHGESEYNTRALLGGNSGLSPKGQAYARQLPDIIVDRIPLTTDGATMPVSVWTSTLNRTIQTAEGLPFPKLRWKVLDEIQAGIFDGWTYAQIEKDRPEEFAARKADKLRYRYPSGESYMDVVQRLEPVVIEIERERECVCVCAHQAILRALYGYFTKTPLADIPRLEIPLHTLIELVPKPDGKMAEERIHLDVIHETIKKTIPLARDQSGQLLSVPSTPFTPLHKTMTDINLAAMAASAGFNKEDGPELADDTFQPDWLSSAASIHLDSAGLATNSRPRRAIPRRATLGGDMDSMASSAPAQTSTWQPISQTAFSRDSMELKMSSAVAPGAQHAPMGEPQEDADLAKLPSSRPRARGGLRRSHSFKPPASGLPDLPAMQAQQAGAPYSGRSPRQAMLDTDAPVLEDSPLDLQAGWPLHQA